jgi:phospholipid/cholesterol/gamma-HCH transport system substrate-binding protein
MEIRARYVLIGLFVLAIAAACVGFVYWLANTGGIAERTAYQVRFDGPISGLSRGSTVLFNGVPVGEVTDLGLIADQPNEVLATISIVRDVPVRADTHVGLVFSGLTGTAQVALVGGAPDAAPVPATGGQPPLLVADPASMKDVTQQARDVLSRLDQILAENSASLHDAIGNIDNFAGALARNSNRVDGILQGLERLTGGKTEAPPNSFDLTSPKSFPQIAAIPDAQLVVPNPTAVLTLDTQRIVMAGANGEAPAFPDARWVDNLPIVIQNRVIEGFGNAGYDKVGTDAGGLHADYQLVLNVRQFRIATVPGPAKADVSLAAKILDGDGKVVGAKVFDAEVPATSIDAAAGAAAALDQAFGKAATDLIVWSVATIDDAVKAASEKPKAEAPAPDTGAPDTGASDNSAPDTATPDSAAPQSGAPDTRSGADAGHPAAPDSNAPAPTTKP